MKTKKEIPNTEDVKYEITVSLKNNQAIVRVFTDGKLQPQRTTVLDDGDQYSLTLRRMLEWKFGNELSIK